MTRSDRRSDDKRAELGGVEAAVDAAGSDQLVVAPFLGDARFIDHDDAVSMSAYQSTGTSRTDGGRSPAASRCD